MIIVTSGAKYIDIDAYACCVAYAELLNLQGKPAIAASTAVWNESITNSLRVLNAPFTINYTPKEEDQFVMVDLSDPSHFDKIVDEDRVIKVVDHHPGFEQYWVNKIGVGANIEFIGAAATLVFEQWVKAGRENEISQKSAALIAAAILDNTLNFGAQVTTDRDKSAYEFLKNHANLDDTWVARYFTECQGAILADLPKALRNDSKVLKFAGLNEELCLGQVVVWSAKSIVADKQAILESVLSGIRKDWMVNVVSISEGRSYFIAHDETVKNWAEKLLHISFKQNVAKADRLWLRKEIIKASIS